MGSDTDIKNAEAGALDPLLLQQLLDKVSQSEDPSHSSAPASPDDGAVPNAQQDILNISAEAVAATQGYISDHPRLNQEQLERAEAAVEAAHQFRQDVFNIIEEGGEDVNQRLAERAVAYADQMRDFADYTKNEFFTGYVVDVGNGLESTAVALDPNVDVSALRPPERDFSAGGQPPNPDDPRVARVRWDEEQAGQARLDAIVNDPAVAELLQGGVESPAALNPGALQDLLEESPVETLADFAPLQAAMIDLIQASGPDNPVGPGLRDQIGQYLDDLQKITDAGGPEMGDGIRDLTADFGQEMRLTLQMAEALGNENTGPFNNLIDKIGAAIEAPAAAMGPVHDRGLVGVGAQSLNITPTFDVSDLADEIEKFNPEGAEKLRGIVDAYTNGEITAEQFATELRAQAKNYEVEVSENPPPRLDAKGNPLPITYGHVFKIEPNKYGQQLLDIANSIDPADPGPSASTQPPDMMPRGLAPFQPGDLKFGGLEPFNDGPMVLQAPYITEPASINLPPNLRDMLDIQDGGGSVLAEPFNRFVVDGHKVAMERLEANPDVNAAVPDPDVVEDVTPVSPSVPKLV